MEKGRKKNIKRIVSLVCIAAVVVGLAFMPLIAAQETEEDGPKASILSGTVSAGSIPTELIGGGTLAEEDAVTVSVPSAVKLEKFLVSNGMVVNEGDSIASVDRVTVMTAISEVQETLEYLSEQIEEAGDEVSETTVTALAGGTVKILYAEEGESVQNVMMEHGALAVLSLDGLMAVDFETESALASGSMVQVTLSDGTVIDGKVVKNLAGEMTITVEDDDFTVGDVVNVTDEDGVKIGSGELYIYSPWNATAYTGTVGSVKVSVGDKLRAGGALMKLSDVGDSAVYLQLIGQRQEYEELMLNLFKMYQTETICAPCDGIVSGIDKNSLQLLSANGTGYSLTFLANAPNGDDETLYYNYLGKVTAVAENGWVLKINPEAIPIADYMALVDIRADEQVMTQTLLYTKTEVPIYSLTDGAWVQVERTEVKTGDVLLFAVDEQGEPIWSVLMAQSETPTNMDTSPEMPSDPLAAPAPSAQPEASAAPQPSIPSGSTVDSTIGSIPSGSNGFMTGGFNMNGGMVEQEPEFELYALDMTEIAAVTPQSMITLDITVDEQDVKNLQVGMSAQVKINALGGEKYTATITEIGNTGTNNGGSSKYTVELTMARSENILSGMNASATVVLSMADGVLTLPADALVELGNKTVVYTGYDEETETLLDPVEVVVGKSDGENVEILEGLADGQTYYYAYYDTLEISFTPDFGGGGFMFG